MDWLRAHLAGKLFLSYLLVVSVGSLTLFITADVAGPVLFSLALAHEMHMPGMASMLTGSSSGMGTAIEAAFQFAMVRAHLVAVAVGTLAALLVSLFVARQIVRPLQRMLAATRRIAAGHYAERVPVAATGALDELGQLAVSFNAMAAALEQTDRRRQELIGDVAHELRTPIATLEGYLEGLLDGVVEPSTATWARLHDEAGRMRRLVDDLQELSRAEARQLSLVLAPIAPLAIATVARDRLRPAFGEKGLELRVAVPDDLPRVRADAGRAAQVLTNLLTNALRYTPAPGQVVVTARRDGKRVRFSVADSGIGFTDEQVAHLFERFYRVDRSRSRALGGSGIGLTIARALVEAMEGELTAASPGQGRGSTFTFTLPIADEIGHLSA